MTLPFGPAALTKGTAEGISGSTDIRLGTIQKVTSRGVDVDVQGGLVQDVAHLDSYNPAVGEPVLLLRFQDAWTVLGRPIGPGTSTDLSGPSGGFGMTLLDGMVLSGANVDLVATTSGSPQTVPRYGVSFYHPSGHWVGLLLTINWYGTAANDGMTVRVLEAPGGTVVASIDLLQGGTGGIGLCSTFLVACPPSLGGTKRTYTLTLHRFAGTGTVRLYDPSSRKGSLMAYDLGDQSIIRTV